MVRWKTPKPLTEKDYGKTRVVERFLFAPLTLNEETRWLEKALIEQEVTFNLILDPDETYSERRLPLLRHYLWKDKSWVEPPANLS